MSLNLVMMATGEFALPGFKALIASGHNICALVTQPDRVNPRKVVHPHPLKEYAIEQGIAVLQPDSINDPESVKKLQALRPDVVMVAAYGQILSAEVINIATKGTYNLHGSLLPRHRGASPIQCAIWKGDKKTGVTVFRIEPKIDAGPMIVKQETDILPDDTSGTLHDRLAIVGADAVLEALRLIESGKDTPLPQDASLVTKSPKITKKQGEIDWNQTPSQIDCHLRAMQPWPKPYSFLHHKVRETERIIILKVTQPAESAGHENKKPGQIIEAGGDSLVVQTAAGPIRIELMQKAGKKVVTVQEYLRGNVLTTEDYFGPEL